MKKLKDVDYKIISELMKNSRISDRKLATIVGVSQPTVSRKRAMFEKEGLVEYNTTLNLIKFGFEIMAFIFASWKHEFRKDMNTNSEAFKKKTRAFFSKHPNILYASTGRGLGMARARMFISLHRSYADYAKFMTELEEQWGRYLEKNEIFIISLKSDSILRPLTFKYLAEYLKAE